MSGEDWGNDFFDAVEDELEDRIQEAAEEEQVKPPKLYSVVIMNDDFTTWPFVIEVFVRFFGKSTEEGHRLTHEIHTKGKAIAGIYTKDIAETKAQLMNDYAQSQGHPLHAETEELPE